MTPTDPNPAGHDGAIVPMFPLGTVVFPGQLLPLQLFEPRYLVLIADVLAGDGTFGVVLIERGSEVGGGDARSTAGCLVRVQEARQLGDGRVALLAQGTDRIEVMEWLPDDPFPRARIRVVHRPPSPPDDADRVATALSLFDALTALVAPDATLDLPADLDPSVLVDELSARIGFGSFDAQQLLTAATVGDQLDRLATLLRDSIELIRLERGPR